MNWARLLQQLMKASLGLGVRLQCVNFAIKYVPARFMLIIMKMTLTFILPNLRHSNLSSLIALLASWYDATRFATLDWPLQSALFEALPRLLPLFPSTISRHVVSTLFLQPFSENAAAKSTREDRRQQHKFAVCALTSLNSTLAEDKKLPTPVLSELHTAVLEVYRRLPGPVRITSAQQASGRRKPASVKVDTRRMQLMSLLTSSLASLPPLLLESSLPPDAQFTRAPSMTSKKHGKEQTVELEAAAKSVVLRSLLVERKVLPLASLHACRTWCLSQAGGTPACHARRALP